MKIEPFAMHVTPEQSKIVQEILFENDYSWVNGEIRPMYLDHDDLYLSFGSYNKGVNTYIRCCYSEDNTEQPITTFNEFMKKYSKKAIRNKKLKQLHENSLHI